MSNKKGETSILYMHFTSENLKRIEKRKLGPKRLVAIMHTCRTQQRDRSKQPTTPWQGYIGLYTGGTQLPAQSLWWSTHSSSMLVPELTLSVFPFPHRRVEVSNMWVFWMHLLEGCDALRSARMLPEALERPLLLNNTTQKLDIRQIISK